MTYNKQYIITVLFFIGIHTISSAQHVTAEIFKNDSLIVIEKNVSKGFFNDYILFIPKGVQLNKKNYLLVEPNNTGKLSDSIEVHKKYALNLASLSSVGNNISTELKIPLLVPIFPRPASKPLTYTHALDRDVMLEKTKELMRLDLQLLAMIDDATIVLKTVNIELEDKIFMNGFSASATFTNRFSMIHPDKIQALAIGGFNGILMLPQNDINGIKINYPIGINDFQKLFYQKFDMEKYKSIPQFIYMGQLDENDAVQFDDAYSKKERKIINDHIGKTVQNRYIESQKYYLETSNHVTFRTFEEVGHWTTSEVNLEIIKFFLEQINMK